MVGIIVYLIGCFVVACILTFLYVMMRPVNSRDELKSWRILLVLYGLSLVGPYAYDEVMTRLVGGTMKKAVVEALNQAGEVGDLQYYKVVLYSGQKARVVAVSQGKASWGGSDKPIVAISLDKDGNGWRVESYRVIASFASGNDGFTFPPYW